MCCALFLSLFFFKQKTAYEMRISDWSSDVCSSDLPLRHQHHPPDAPPFPHLRHRLAELGEVEAAVDGGADLAFAPPGEELVHRRLHLSSITFTLVDRAPADILAPVEARHADILEQQQVDADLRDPAAGGANGDEIAADGGRTTTRL